MVTWASRAAAAISIASAAFIAIGFSQRTGSRRSRAAIVIGKCDSFVDATITASISLLSSIAFQSVKA